MSTEEIIKLAFQLGESIAASDEIDVLKEVQNKLNQNKDAYDLIMRYQDARIKLDNKQTTGLIIGQQEENHVAILEQQLNNNAIVQELIQAQEKFNNLMQAVYFAMNQAISGGAQSCGDCNSCNGTCGL